MDERIKSIEGKLAQLRLLDPKGEALSGADSHGYRLNPPASEKGVAAFEEKHGLTLPDGYREFVLKAGNGGAGPFYGLWELAVVDDALTKAACEEGLAINNKKHPLFEKATFVSFSPSPQYSSVHWNAEGSEGRERKLAALERNKYSDFTEKALDIGTEGCNISILLVLTGPCRGEVWTVWAEEFFGFSYYSPKHPVAGIYSHRPFETDGDGALQFLDWYEHWLNAGLSRLKPLTS